MAFTNNELMSFNDLQTLIDTENFVEKNPFSPTAELADKVAANDALYLVQSLLTGLSDNEIVAYEDLSPGNVIALDILVPGDNNPAHRFLETSNLSISQTMTIRFTLTAESLTGLAYVEVAAVGQLTDVNDTYDYVGLVTEGQLFSIYIINGTAGDTATIKCDIISAAVDLIPVPSFINTDLSVQVYTLFAYQPAWYSTGSATCAGTFYVENGYSTNADELNPVTGDYVYEDATGTTPINGGNEWVKMDNLVAIQVAADGEVLDTYNC